MCDKTPRKEVDFLYQIQLADGRWIEVTGNVFDMWTGKRRSKVIYK